MKTIKQNKAEVSIDASILEQAETDTEHCTIIHGTYGNPRAFMQRVRIWPTTYLVQENGVRKKLLHSFNIPPYPQWKCFNGPTCSFTLLFERLDKDCKVFDLLEDIPESGEFFIPGIKRNTTDVYRLHFK